MKKRLLIAAISSALLISACEPNHHTAHHKVKHHTQVVTQYQVSSDDVIEYLYVFSDRSDNRPISYYKSSSPIAASASGRTSFSSITSTAVVGGRLPADVEKQAQEGKEVDAQELEQDQEPIEVDADGNVVPDDQEVETESTETDTATESDTGSTDSGSTDSGSADSGGGDSGGGGE